MGIKTGEAIRAARTGAKLPQTALAKAVGLTPGEIGKAERGELELSKEALKAVAKAAGVTQTSLLNAEQAPKAEKAPKKESSPLKLTAAETKLIKLYRKATPEQKSDINRILNGEKTEVEQLVDALLGDKWKKKVKRK